MKIQRKSAVKSCEEVAVEAMIPETCPYTTAIEYIRCAIEDLGAVASTDAIARESIANLSVVLFDLKS